MLIGNVKKLSSQNELHLTINTESLPIVKIQKLLGIYIDENLSWNDHIIHISKSVSKKISLLRRLKKFLPIHARKLFYTSYIQPLLDYCCTVWGSCTQTNINNIIKLQKRAARIILDAPFLTPSADMFKTLQWLSFDKRIKYHQSPCTGKYSRGM